MIVFESRHTCASNLIILSLMNSRVTVAKMAFIVVRHVFNWAFLVLRGNMASAWLGSMSSGNPNVMFPSQMLTGQHVCKFQENNFEYHMKSMILNML